MAPDEGIDKQRILDEIVGLTPMPEDLPQPSEPSVPVIAVPEVPSAPVPLADAALWSPAPPPPVAVPESGRFRHRREIAAIVMAFAGVVWVAVGLATRQLWPGVIVGAAFLVPGLAAAARGIR